MREAFSRCKLACECTSRNDWSIYECIHIFSAIRWGDYRFVQMNKLLQSRMLLNGSGYLVQVKTHIHKNALKPMRPFVLYYLSLSGAYIIFKISQFLHHFILVSVSSTTPGL